MAGVRPNGHARRLPRRAGLHREPAAGDPRRRRRPAGRHVRRRSRSSSSTATRSASSSRSATSGRAASGSAASSSSTTTSSASGSATATTTTPTRGRKSASASSRSTTARGRRRCLLASPGSAGEPRVGGEQAEAPGKQQELAVEQADQALEAVRGRPRLEERLATWQLDLDDARQEMREDRRVIGDDQIPASGRGGLGRRLGGSRSSRRSGGRMRRRRGPRRRSGRRGARRR